MAGSLADAPRIRCILNGPGGDARAASAVLLRVMAHRVPSQQAHDARLGGRSRQKRRAAGEPRKLCFVGISRNGGAGRQNLSARLLVGGLIGMLYGSAGGSQYVSLAALAVLSVRVCYVR